MTTWMTDKIATLAKDKSARDGNSPADSINAISGEVFQTMRGELTAFPDCARLLPVSLARNLRAGSFSALSAFELGCLVIADADAQAATPCAGPDDISAFTNLKFEALAELLKAEDEGVRNV